MGEPPRSNRINSYSTATRKNYNAPVRPATRDITEALTMDDRTRSAALEYHRLPRPGKIAVTPTKALTNQSDLSLAYSPGVAAACDEIVRDPSTASMYTSRGNLVAVVTNG